MMVLGLDVDRVSNWLEANVADLARPLEFTLMTGGHSNLTYSVTDANGRTIALRRPPVGTLAETAHDMRREHRIIAALRAAGMAVPEALALCADETVTDAPFFAMSFVEGLVLDCPEAATRLAGAQRQAAGRSLIDRLAQLHVMDVGDVGLADLAQHDRYVERQLKRWSIQWTNGKTRDVPAIEEVERRLRASIPRQQRVSVTHGDYRFGNCVVEPGAGSIAAVLDWELCTLGDPLADLGYLLGFWTDPGESSRRPSDPTGAGGFGSRDECVARYARATGLDPAGIDYYVALGTWRVAVIAEGVRTRLLAGALGESKAESSAAATDRTALLADEALELL